MLKRINVPIAFILLGICSLLFGAIGGLLASIQYVTPDYLKDILPFSQMRELHVTSVVSWIILISVGGIYYFLPNELKLNWHFNKLPNWHFLLYLATGITIVFALFTKKMGGREYMTFAPWLMLPIVFGWILMAINYFKTTVFSIRRWPVYLWMWATGLVFMIFHLSEANFWLFDHFRSDFIRDITVQWKSYGSITGSWNMLVYGTAIFLMSKLSDDGSARSKTAFFFYFLGLTNLMLGWAHHIYPVPSQSWIRGLAYVISMTEWIVLFSLITNWLKSVKKKDREGIRFPYTFLLITDIWIIVNVLIALLMSIPAINHFTHGTHVTVAHSMGTTIGINTSILLSSIMFIVSRLQPKFLEQKKRILLAGTVLYNVSLFVFLLTLIIAGIIKGQMMYQPEINHSTIMEAIHPYMLTFHYAGGLLLTSFFILVIPLLKPLHQHLWLKPNAE